MPALLWRERTVFTCALPPRPPYFSAKEYLQIEAQSPIKHEYIDGRLYAMVGVSEAHNLIAGNLITLLRNHLRGSGCRVFFSGMKVRIEARNRFYYPDVLVTWDERDRDRDTLHFKRFPKLIVEILSDSTEAFDRGDKFEDYQSLESLREYVLVSSKRPLVQCFRRTDARLWVLQSYTGEQESFELLSLDLLAPLAALYEDVSLLG
nr:Uma2 family endonuclease [Gloeobacter kilaueensis]